MASLQLKLLGGFAASGPSGRPVELAGKKNQALLAYLAVNRGKRHSREKLKGLLWGDRAETQARGSLRQALAALKEALAGVEPVPLVLDGDSIALDPAAVSTDVASFEQLVGSESADDLRQAAKLYEGDLLDEMALRDPAFDEWLSVERARLREALMGALSRLISQLTGAEAIAVGKRLIALDPLRESSHRSLMQAYATAGENTLGLQAYASCRDLLKAELGVAPAKATEELRQRILKGEEAHPAPSQSDETPTSQHQKAASVAVLPFTNMSADPEQEYFSDGLTEDIITDLSRISALFVVARHTAFTFKGKPIDIGEAARKLNVGYILEGSVRKVGSRIRINVQLIDGTTGDHLWAERYDRDLGDIFALQDDISENVVTALKVNLLPGELAALAHRPTRNAEAYEYYLLGRSTLYGGWGDKESLRAARLLFSKAVEVDPGYARAYAGMADCDTYLWSAGDLDVSTEDILANSTKALALAPNLAEANASKGLALYRAGHPDEGALALKRAIELDPDLFEAHFFYGTTCWITGHYREAAEQFERATELRSTDYVGLNMLATVYACLELHDQCVAAARRGMARIEKALIRRPDDPVILAWGASTLAWVGENKRASEWADPAVVLAPNDYFVRHVLASAYAAIGRPDAALECLEFVYSLAPRARPVFLGWVNHDRQLDSLRQRQDFKSFMRRLEADAHQRP